MFVGLTSVAYAGFAPGKDQKTVCPLLEWLIKSSACTGADMIWAVKNRNEDIGKAIGN
jgi:hypothetical protein